MVRTTCLAVTALLAAAMPADVASAATLAFNGSASGVAVTAPDATCAPYTFRGTVTSAPGTSNLGGFAYSHNSCTQGAIIPVSLANGDFQIAFTNGMINGRFDGTSIPRAGTPMLFDQDFLYTILGGTGIFAGASGTFRNLGTVDVRGGPPAQIAFNFNGLIDAPAVPEPGTWAMLILAFFGMGAALRGRNARAGKTLLPATA